MKIIETEMISEPSWATFGLTNEDADGEEPSIHHPRTGVLCLSRNECQEVCATTVMVIKVILTVGRLYIMVVLAMITIMLIIKITIVISW